MERTEPSLFPEWLRPAGVNGNGNSAHHGQTPSCLDDSIVLFRSRQRNSFGGLDYDSSKHSVTSDRTACLPSRRAARNGERESYQHAHGHFHFGRAPSYRSFELSDREREGQRRAWDWNNESDSDGVLNSAGLDDSKQLNAASSRWPGASGARSSARYESDVALKRSSSMGLPSRVLESGDKKVSREICPSAASVSTGGFSGSIQKAAFDKNFPSLGSQDRYTALGGANAPVLSPRLLRQSTFSKLDVSHSSSSGSGVSGSALDVSVTEAVSVSDSKCGSAVLVSASNLTHHNLPSNGAAVSIAASIMVTSAQMQAHSSAILPKMAEALVQNPPRVRSPPQVPLETQRLEELALKQSRQLIPMKPSLPKTMGSRDKSKPKVVRNADVDVSTLCKINQPTGFSHLTCSTYRTPFSPKPEVSKLPQGKLLLLKTSKEMQVFDRQAMSPTQVVTNEGDVGNASHAKESNVEDKRTLLQAQNRTDFFNALRKKAASNMITSENRDKAESYENSVRDSSGCTDESKRISTDGVERECEIVDKELQNSEDSKSSISDFSVQQKVSIRNGLIVDIPEAILGNPSALDGHITGTSEEEEAAFLRSLGWEEGTDDGEALTEEEINAFYQHKQTVCHSVSLPHCNSQQPWRPAVNLHVGSIGSVSSGLGSSSDSDDERV